MFTYRSVVVAKVPGVARERARGGRTLLIAALAVAFAGAPALTAQAQPAAAVRLLGVQTVPFGLNFQGTTVGGLSGIDYRSGAGDYVLISDDRSDVNPARFYTAQVPVDGNGVGPVTFTDTRPLLTPNGTNYPPKSIDPEEIRVDPWTGNYFWTQEGERTDTVLADPSIRITTPDGVFAGALPIPDNERMQPNSGPRRNSALEAATFAAGGTLFVTAVEAPLLQDGPDATHTSGALTRFTVQARFGPLLAQYAYPMEPVFAPGTGSNGIPAILAADPYDPAKFLVMERAFVVGAGNKIRIYQADIAGATNVLGAPLGAARPMNKRLLADLDDLGLDRIDNIEGMTWGPRLPSGERTLILVSDNNFSDQQITQFIALAVR